MMNDNNGNGVNAGTAGASPVSYGEYRAFSKGILSDMKEFRLILTGTDGRGGLVGEVRDLKSQSQLIRSVGSVVSGVLSAVATAVFLRLIGAI